MTCTGAGIVHRTTACWGFISSHGDFCKNKNKKKRREVFLQEFHFVIRLAARLVPPLFTSRKHLKRAHRQLQNPNSCVIYTEIRRDKVVPPLKLRTRSQVPRVLQA